MTNIGVLGKQDKGTSIKSRRREILLGIGTAAAATYAGSALSATSTHDHSKHIAQQPDLLDAANQCLDKGQRCIAHCLVTYQEGDLELADCAFKVNEMLAVCRAFSYLLAANSEYIKEYARVCEKVCADCEKECRKHEKHVECKACAQACSDIVALIQLQLT